jgi:tetratricopeptide (TPR) repeat protein
MSPSQEYLFRRGIRLQQSGQTAEAIAVYRELVAMDRQVNAAWLNLAMLLHQNGSAEAPAAFAEFIRTAPPDHPMLGLAATALSEAGLPTRAR